MAREGFFSEEEGVDEIWPFAGWLVVHGIVVVFLGG